MPIFAANLEEQDSFEVAGAGTLRLSGPSYCGGATGVGISVSWGRHDWAGGVMDVKEVKRLISRLQEHLDHLDRIGPWPGVGVPWIDKGPPIYADGRPPTSIKNPPLWKELEGLLKDVHVFACLKEAQYANMTRDETLLLLVRSLAKDRQDLSRMLVASTAWAPNPLIVDCNP